ncbi:tautomerase family protein [Catellatospora paridis]|uniref:tautomerase family protein n=1 Tax=Catellatospora paridis TaxID=1617086 RepID=UPI0012D4B7C0|nr:4-oxalocrotonate tautomerase family protein [Catellatospora paridis]
MPLYSCTIAQGMLSAKDKAALAAEITRIHSDINHVPPEYVNVVFTELPPENIYVGAKPGRPVLISGWSRRGHPQQDTTRPALEVSATAARIAGVEESSVLVVTEDSPAQSAVEGGRALPEPGGEAQRQAEKASGL